MSKGSTTIGSLDTLSSHPTLEKYRIRIRDVLYETLRTSSALAYVSTRAIENINSRNPYYSSPEFLGELPNWFSTLNSDCQNLHHSQTRVGRDLRFLLSDKDSLKIIDKIETAEIELEKPHTLDPPITDRIDVVHKDLTGQMGEPYKQYKPSGNRQEKMDDIRSVLLNPSSGAVPVASSQSGNIFVTDTQTPAKPVPGRETAGFGGASAKAPGTQTPSHLEIKNFSNPNSMFKSGLEYSPSPSKRSMAYSDVMRMSTSSSAIKRQHEVKMHDTHRYSIIGESEVLDYQSPVEGHIDLLDESRAKLSHEISNMPSTYVRVIKEYKGESYIVKGRYINPDGSGSKSIRHTISSASPRPSPERSSSYVNGSFKKEEPKIYRGSLNPETSYEKTIMETSLKKTYPPADNESRQAIQKTQPSSQVPSTAYPTSQPFPTSQASSQKPVSSQPPPSPPKATRPSEPLSSSNQDVFTTAGYGLKEDHQRKEQSPSQPKVNSQMVNKQLFQEDTLKKKEEPSLESIQEEKRAVNQTPRGLETDRNPSSVGVSDFSKTNHEPNQSVTNPLEVHLIELAATEPKPAAADNTDPSKQAISVPKAETSGVKPFTFDKKTEKANLDLPPGFLDNPPPPPKEETNIMSAFSGIAGVAPDNDKKEVPKETVLQDNKK